MITNWGVGDKGEFCDFRSHKGFPNVNSQLEMPMIFASIQQWQEVSSYTRRSGLR